MLINIKIRDKIAEAVNPPDIICGNDGYTLAFDFDAEWAEHSMKTMRVTWLDTFSGQQKHADTEFTGTYVKLPVINDAYEIGVGVYAGDALASTPAHLDCERSITDGAVYHDEPEPEVYEQLLDAITRQYDTKLPIGSAILFTDGTSACTVGTQTQWEEI